MTYVLIIDHSLESLVVIFLFLVFFGVFLLIPGHFSAFVVGSILSQFLHGFSFHFSLVWELFPWLLDGMRPRLFPIFL